MNARTPNNPPTDHQAIDDLRHAPAPVTPRPRYSTPSNPSYRSSDRAPWRSNGPGADILYYACGPPGHISPRCPLNWNWGHEMVVSSLLTVKTHHSPTFVFLSIDDRWKFSSTQALGSLRHSQVRPQTVNLTLADGSTPFPVIGEVSLNLRL